MMPNTNNSMWPAVQFVGAQISEGQFFLAMEHMAGGTLFHRLALDEEGSFAWSDESGR